MDIFKAGVKDGLRLSEELEVAKMRIRHVKFLMEYLHIDLEEACQGLDTTVEEYHAAQKRVEEIEEDFANLSSKNISSETIEWLEYHYGFGR